MTKRMIPLLILAVILLGCAKKSSEWKENHVLEAAWVVGLVGNPLDLSVSGDKLYVAEDQGGMSIINLNDYSRQWITSFVSVSGDTLPLIKIRKVSSINNLNRLFINETDGSDLIRIIDTANPDSMKVIDNITGATSDVQDMRFQPITYAGSLFTYEGVFCTGRSISYGKYGEHFPGFPPYWAITSTFITPSSANGAFLDSQNLYVAAEQRGLLIYNRTSESLIGECDLPGEAQKVVVSGNYAYLACRQDGLQIVNVSDPTAPIRIGSFDTSGYATNLDIWNNYVVVSSGGGGIYLFDVTSPANPVLVDQVTDCGYVNNVRFHNGKVLVASRDKGIVIYNLIP